MHADRRVARPAQSPAADQAPLLTCPHSVYVPDAARQRPGASGQFTGRAGGEGDQDVDHGEAEGDPPGGLGADTLLHRGDELPGHRAADDLVDELDARADRQRLDLDLADGVLAVAAGLLDVPAARRGP